MTESADRHSAPCGERGAPSALLIPPARNSSHGCESRAGRVAISACHPAGPRCGPLDAPNVERTRRQGRTRAGIGDDLAVLRARRCAMAQRSRWRAGEGGVSMYRDGCAGPGPAPGRPRRIRQREYEIPVSQGGTPPQLCASVPREAAMPRLACAVQPHRGDTPSKHACAPRAPPGLPAGRNVFAARAGSPTAPLLQRARHYPGQQSPQRSPHGERSVHQWQR